MAQNAVVEIDPLDMLVHPPRNRREERETWYHYLRCQGQGPTGEWCTAWIWRNNMGKFSAGDDWGINCWRCGTPWRTTYLRSGFFTYRETPWTREACLEQGLQGVLNKGFFLQRNLACTWILWMEKSVSCGVFALFGTCCQPLVQLLFCTQAFLDSCLALSKGPTKRGKFLLEFLPCARAAMMKPQKKRLGGGNKDPNNKNGFPRCRHGYLCGQAGWVCETDGDQGGIQFIQLC